MALSTDVIREKLQAADEALAEAERLEGLGGPKRTQRASNQREYARIWVQQAHEALQEDFRNRYKKGGE